MFKCDPTRAAGATRPRDGFVLYLEGPGDRGILDAWCRRLLPGFAARLSRACVILGGRRPARALTNFRERGGADSGLRGLCVLDRDGAEGAALPDATEPGLEFFTWGRRHIESYLLVPPAIRRELARRDPQARVARAVHDLIPGPDDEAAWRELDAKRLLGPRGPLQNAFGAPLPLARIARATRSGELHGDVHGFFERLRSVIGVSEAEVVR